MRVDSEGARSDAAAGAAPSRVSQPPDSAKSRPGPVPTAMPTDRVDTAQTGTSNNSSGVGSLRDWVQNEWSTVAAAAHGLAAAPGVVSSAWHDAAKTNAGLANTIDSALDHWQAQTAAQRQAAIDGLRKTAAPISTTATGVADDLSRANRLPLAVENAVNNAIGVLPANTQTAMKNVARSVGSALHTLPAPVEARARAGAHALAAAASAQTAKASTTLGTFSELIGRTVGKTHGMLTGRADGGSILDKLPVVRDTPVAGVVLTAAAVASDVHAGKSAADALIANVGGSLVGAVAGSALSAGLSTWIDSAAIADEGAAALGAAAAAGPVGWTVAAGVIAATAVGFGFYKAVESNAGQDVINGVTQLAGDKIERGLGEAQSDLRNSATNALRIVAGGHSAVPG